jgi:hypothetical protein
MMRLPNRRQDRPGTRATADVTSPSLAADAAAILAAVVLCAATLAVPAALAKSDVVKVTLMVPQAAKVDMTGLRRVLVTQMIVDEEVPDFDLSHELVGVLRHDLKEKAGLEMIEVEPPALPEQPIRDLLANTGFWHRMAETYHADLIIAGEASFKTADRSGYVQIDEISPMTGQRVRRTRFVDREAFLLDLRLFIVRGAGGDLAWEDHFSGDKTYNGKGYDRLSGLFDMYEQMGDDIRSIVAPRERQVQRTLFNE